LKTVKTKVHLTKIVRAMTLVTFRPLTGCLVAWK